MKHSGFRLICELASPSRPNLGGVVEEMAAWSGVASSFLATDSHLGRATVSSTAVAHEVVRRGEDAIACLNARDRNLLGFRRDLLTASAYGIDQLLLVRGDRPSTVAPTSDLTVREMLSEVRTNDLGVEVRAAVTSRLQPLPMWKQDADALFVQCVFSVDSVLTWAESLDFAGPIYPGVIALSSAEMAKRLSSTIAEMCIPTTWIDMLERDPSSGVAMAADLVSELKESGIFPGAHIIPAGRHRELADRLRCSSDARSSPTAA